MWKQDLEALLKAWPENRLIKKLEAAIGGIAITDTSEDHWFYDHNGGILIKKGPWKKNHKDSNPKTEADTPVHISVVEGVTRPYFLIEKDPEGGERVCYDINDTGIAYLKQKVHGREIAWETGWNVFVGRELTAEESEHWIRKYLEYVEQSQELSNECRANQDEADSESCEADNQNRPWERLHRRIKDPRKEVEEIYKKMREFADQRGYTLTDSEIGTIIVECEEGDSILDCSDGMLREIVEDWIADHQV